LKPEKIKNYLGIIVAVIIILSAISTAGWALIDWRIEIKQEPIVRELQLINCFLRVSLDSTQQKEAENLYKAVTKKPGNPLK